MRPEIPVVAQGLILERLNPGEASIPDMNNPPEPDILTA
jgi:hypothetical protein